MRRLINFLTASAMTFVLVACSAPSLNGLPKSSRVKLDGVEGVWYSDDIVVHVKSKRDRLYSVHMVGAHAPLQLSFTRIDGWCIADSALDKSHLDNVDPLLVMYTIPVHRFARIRLDGDTLRFSELKDGWVTSQATARHGGIARSGGDPILKGDEQQLLALFRAALEDEDAWDSETVFTRVHRED